MLNGVGWAAASCVDDRCKSTQTAGILLSAGLVTLCGVSAAAGFGSSSQCEEVQDQNALCIAGNDRACSALNDGWEPRMKIPLADVPLSSKRPACKATDPELEKLRPAGYVSPDEENCDRPRSPSSGCSKDTDCKGDRVCERGACVEADQDGDAR